MMKKKNVLLLSMSTLPKELKVQNYYFMENDVRRDFYGYSQLEPITKLLLQKLGERGEKLDKIVIMTSKEALETKVEIIKCAAVPFYMQRIQEFLTEREKQEAQDCSCFEEQKTMAKNNYLKEHHFEEDVNAISVKDTVVEIVKIYDKKEIEIFFEVIEMIKENDNDINLYLDMQGGNRNAIAQMNAIVSLLEEQGVMTKERYSVDFNYENEEHPINEVSQKYTAYQLIGAMQAFKRYGRGQSLIEYFKDSKTKRDTEVLDAIEKASNAIRLCNIGDFDEAVAKIAKIKAERVAEKIGGESKEKTELDIVFEDIQRDYGKLLEQGNENQGMYIAKIKWCLEKGFIQQALTIIESKMPDYLFERGIITVDKDEEIKGTNKKESEIKKVSEILKQFRTDLKKEYVSCEHIAIEQLSRENTVENRKTKTGKTEKVFLYDIPEKVTTLVQLLKDLQRYKKESCIKVYSKEKKMKINYIVPYSINLKYMENKKANALAHFIKLHWILKEQRNTINHGSDKKGRFSKEKLERYIRFYVELGEFLEIDPV